MRGISLLVYASSTSGSEYELLAPLKVMLQKCDYFVNHFIFRSTALGRKLTTQLNGAMKIIFRYSFLCFPMPCLFSLS